MAALTHLIQTILRDQEVDCLHAAGSHLSGGDPGSEGLGHWDAFAFAAEAAAALLPTASEYLIWEVEVDALLQGTAVVQGGQEASLEVVLGQHVMEIYLLGQEQVQGAVAGYLVPASVEPHWREAAGEGEDAP